MIKKIIALTDYKNNFGSKHFDKPYRSGMDKNLLISCFKNEGYEIEFIQFSTLVNEAYLDQDCYYIYTSSEDDRYLYKNFIEDIVLYLEMTGCKVIPHYKFLRANNNKTFMELLRKDTGDKDLLSIHSKFYGAKEELHANIDKLKYPVVIKTAEGASGKGVFKAENIKELVRKASKISSSKNIKVDLWDYGRSLIHKGYVLESKFRRKFVLQNMIKSLKNDWKVYYYMDKLYVFYRPIIKNRGFIASGGGYDNYLYGENAPKPDGFFQFVKKVVGFYNVPHMSLDIGWDGNQFHLFE